ncbi:MAG TPA: (d)CMP kinase [Candidatus Limnocylindrales bacterium]|nr:(d)CMP kinase [Candidatus Limnocylindrales bacterium]
MNDADKRSISPRVRIQKALADAGVASRRKAEDLVATGRVAVNGEPATIGQSVDPSADVIVVDGRPIRGDKPERIYLVLAKPAGVTSTVSDRHAVRTVIDLVPVALRKRAARLYPVGRLDRDSEGLLLLTNDGDWAQRMLHPSHGVDREYAVAVDEPLDDDQIDALETGVRFEEGDARIARMVQATSADVRVLSGLIGPHARRYVWYRVTLRQGMKRQIRRMFVAVEAPVRRLVRLRFGTVRLARMQLGDVRALSAEERRQLEALVGGDTARDDKARSEKARAQKDQADRARDTNPPLRGLVVSVDGPGGSGKSTVGAGAAAKLGYRFCDTGVLYRGLTWLALQRGVSTTDPDALAPLTGEIELAPDDQQRFRRLIIDGRDVTEELHTAEVDREVSAVSQHPQVRSNLMPIQHALAREGRIVMAGRDIGTIVLPDADPKIYLDVSIAERARRRAAARGLGDDPDAVAQIAEELRQRDDIDSHRETAPLRIPDGASVINTEENTLAETIDEVVNIVRRRERDLAK